MRRYATGRFKPLTADEINSMVRTLEDGPLCPYTEGEANLIRAFVATLATNNYSRTRDITDRGPQRCIFDGCVATWVHWHGGFWGGYDNPADPEGAPIPFTDADPEPDAVRDHNGAAIRCNQ